MCACLDGDRPTIRFTVNGRTNGRTSADLKTQHNTTMADDPATGGATSVPGPHAQETAVAHAPAGGGSGAATDSCDNADSQHSCDDADYAKCWWCNSDGCDKKVNGKWIHTDCEDEQEWMEVYAVYEDFKEFCGEHEHLKLYHGFRYFQCWGGGPEGGFITNDKDETYKVNRGWGEPFTVETVDGILDINEGCSGTQLRVVPKPESAPVVDGAGSDMCTACLM